MKKLTIIGLLAFFSIGSAFADCTSELAAVDAELAITTISGDLLQQVIDARNAGESLCNEGANDSAIKKLSEAKFMLGMYAK